jgi:hypothetical protein
MKTTIKEYQAKSEEKRQMNNLKRTAEDNQDYSMSHLLKDSVKLLEAEYFNLLDKVIVSFWCGQRAYYREVTKIGKTYFDGSQKMTKGNGHRFIEEIPEITDKMRNEMIADSYYY